MRGHQAEPCILGLVMAQLHDACKVRVPSSETQKRRQGRKEEREGGREENLYVVSPG